MADFDPGSLPDLLPLYYRRIFPFGPYGRWLRYGDVSKNYFQRQEFSFTLRDDIYVRYQSFNTPQELEKEIQKMCPYKIDIGAVYSHRPIQHNTVHLGAFQAQEKELVFDIDMTDYDDVRRCCSSAEICSKCWTLMTIAIHIIDRALVEDFGIKHRLWVYSGCRGVHCWVCDESVRKWSSTLRSAAVEYLTLVKGGEETIKKVTLPENIHIHPFIRKSVEVVTDYFEAYALVGQDILGSKESYEKVLALVPETVQEELQHEFCKKKQDSVQRWQLFKKKLERYNNSVKKMAHTEWEIMLQYCFPRLDINVSKGINHLLKSPFSVHPKTGRISVPIDLKKLDEFDPLAVPTISRLCQELDSISNDEGDGKESEGEPECPRRSRGYKKTSLASYVKVFEQFLEEFEKSHKKERLAASDMQMDF
ncbi:DNA primase small subunit-like isoform X1 [Hemicordylus capensis]|uniref:DNA primase small subunit-like isoform X1 n=1 Tax=Hemicordylus capensis TaxID=884348 RepID=UPI0023031DB9|nr:DNA primase small subunit-like isoform X1 [Hemicordylus capensis]